MRKPYRLLSSRLLHQGRICRFVQDRFVYLKDPDQTVTRETVVHPGAVVILPFVAPGKIVLVRQFRWASKDHLWEIPAGTIEKGERPLTCARRELEEETGYRARRWTFLTQFFPAPGISDERMWLYRAEGLTPGRRNLDADEWMETHVFSIDKALGMIRRGLIRDGKTLVGILWALQPSLKR